LSYKLLSHKNRNGFSTAHTAWPVKTRVTTCVRYTKLLLWKQLVRKIRAIFVILFLNCRSK
jgi:hypothetical protein